MSALLVVGDHPPIRCLAHILQFGKDVLVEYFLEQGPVEAFDVCVLVALAGRDELDCHAAGLGPLGKCLAQELRTVVRAQQLWKTAIALDLVEGAEAAAPGECVRHEIDRPRHVGHRGAVLPAEG